MNSWSNPWFNPWQDLTRTQPWQSTLEDWWGQFSKQPASPNRQAFENIVAQSRSFFKLAEEFGRGATPADPAVDWQTGLEQIVDQLKQAFGNPDAIQAQNVWQMPLANWQRAVSSMSGLPGYPFAGGSAQGAFDPNAQLDQFLGAPGVGYARELQGAQQELARLIVDYQKVHQKYVAVFIEINRQSLDCMRDRVVARMEDGEEPIGSVRELYDLWVECGEEVYGRHVHTEEYARLHGEMVNALMALKRHSALMMDDGAAAMNLPTRREMDTVHERVQITRRSEKVLRQGLEAARTREHELSQQVEKLLARIERLEQRAAAPVKKTKTKKTTVAAKRAISGAKGNPAGNKRKTKRS